MPNEKKSIYYCNRAFAHIKTESYAIAVFDGCEAIKLDPKNVKGYFRRGTAYAAMRQLKNAVADFKQICRMQPQNREARDKYDVTQKELRLSMLSASIAHEEQKVNVNTDEIIVESDYNGPKLDSIDDVTAEWVVSLMEW